MDLRRKLLFSWSSGYDFGEFKYLACRWDVASAFRKVAARRVRKRVKRAVRREIAIELL